MDGDDIKSFAFESRVWEVLSASYGLLSGYSTGDDGDVVLAETQVVLEECGNVAEPAFSRRNGPDARPGLVLYVNSLHFVSILMTWNN